MVAGSMAAGQTAILSYSREHEKEADQLGFNYLSRTRFSPVGLVTSLEKIRARDYYGTEDIPDYFKTHPGVKKRLSFLESLLKNKQIEPKEPPEETFRFKMVKARLIGLYDKPDRAEEKFRNILAKHPDKISGHYGLALALARQTRIDEALDSLGHALALSPFDPMLILASGRLNLLNGEARNAADILEGIETDPLVGLSATYHLGRARIELGRLDSAERDFDRVLRKLPDHLPKAHYYRARKKKKKGEATLSHYHLGVYYAEADNLENARFHLKKALSGHMDEHLRKRAEKLIKELEERPVGDRDRADQ